MVLHCLAKRATMLATRRMQMANKVKDGWLGGRVDTDLKEKVEEYIDVAEITQGQLIRKAVMEYMKNHPVEDE